MSATNKKSWILVAVGGVAALAAVLYGIRWISHQKTRKVVTEQVEAWEALWLPARACLVGDDTTFTAAGHAYLFHEATQTGELGRERKCEPLVRKLKRPGDESTGVDRVEASWNNVREATKGLTRAFVGVIDQSGYSPMGSPRQLMAEALDAMDAAHAKLRSDSDMEPPSARGRMQPPTPLPEGVRPPALDFMIAPIDPVHGALVLAGGDQQREYQAIVRGLDDIQVRPEESGFSGELAEDRAPWVSWSVTEPDFRYSVWVADLDDNGARVGPGVAAHTLASPDYRITSHFAVGHEQDRAVFFNVGNYTGDDSDPATGLFVTRSSDRGVTFDAPVKLAQKSVLIDHDQVAARFDVALFDDDGTVRWLAVDAAWLSNPVQPRRLFPGSIYDHLDACVAGDNAWWLRARAELSHIKGDSSPRPVALDARDAELVDCVGDTVAVKSYVDTGVVVHQCSAAGCAVALDMPIAGASRVVVGLSQESGVVGATQLENLILLWRDQELAGAHLSEPEYQLRALIEWHGKVHLVMLSQEGTDIRFIPLS